MTREEYRSMMNQVAYLCSCAVNRTVPEAERLQDTDPELLYEAAQKHLLQAAVGMALESAGIRTQKFTQAIAASQRKNALLDADRAQVLTALEKEGIWYMPLKGCLMKDLYPRYGMRQMADNDILVDPDRRKDVRKIMEGLGFSTEQYDMSNHDVYHKLPVSNFEMHHYLINGESNDELETYYLDVKDRLIKDEGNEYGYHFTDEDFYLFMMAHEYKHYVQSGTGLRSLLDTYVYLKQKQDRMDWKYIRQETEKMGIATFEQENRLLSMHLFAGEPLSAKEQKMLDYILSSGTYGTIANGVNNQIQKKGRMGFFLSRVFMPMNMMKNLYPVLRKAPWLYPAMVLWRLISKFFTNNKKYMYEVKAALGLIKKEEE